MDEKAGIRIKQGRLARALAGALLFCIFNGATFELVHRHDDFTLRRASSHAPRNERSISNDDADGSAKNPQQNFQCLICQLHRNLADGLFSPSFIASIVVGSAPLAPRPINLFSNPSAITIRGRAPPHFSSVITRRLSSPS